MAFSWQQLLKPQDILNSFIERKISGALKSIDYAHSEIHNGSHFYYKTKDTIASGSSVDYLLTTPNTDKAIHILWTADGSAVTNFDIYKPTFQKQSLIFFVC